MFNVIKKKIISINRLPTIREGVLYEELEEVHDKYFGRTQSKIVQGTLSRCLQTSEIRVNFLHSSGNGKQSLLLLMSLKIF